MRRLVPVLTPERDALADGVSFCAHCGAVADGDGWAARRVCPRCELGIVLRRPRELAGDALLVVTADLCIAAASAAVEPLLGTPELLLGLPLGEVLDGDGVRRRAAASALAAGGISTHRVRARGRALEARVGRCEAPTAALIALAAA